MSAAAPATLPRVGGAWVAAVVHGFIGTYFLLHAAAKVIAPFDAIASVEEAGVPARVAIAAVAAVAGAEAGFGVAALAARVSLRRAAWISAGALSVLSAWLGVRAFLVGGGAPCACGMPGGPSIRDALARNAIVAVAAIIVGEIAARRR